MLPRDEYLKTLPRKISSAGAIFQNEEGEILLVETSYKKDFDVPGGVIENGESPKTACEREIQEELGLKINLQKLLVCEYQLLEEFECYAFIFDGGVLLDWDISQIQLCGNEIKRVHFIDVKSIGEKTTLHLRNRIEKAVEAKECKKILYYETNYLGKKLIKNT